MNQAAFYGGAKFTTLSANLQLHPTAERVQVFNPTADGFDVKLPEASALVGQTGAPRFYIFNIHATHSIDITLPNGAVIKNLAAGKGSEVLLVSNTSGTTTAWKIHARTINIGKTATNSPRGVITNEETLPPFSPPLCYPPTPIDEGLYVSGYSGAGPKFMHYNPSTDTWTDLSSLIEKGVSGGGQGDIQIYYFPNWDRNAIYLAGDVKKAGDSGSFYRVLRYGKDGIETVGVNLQPIYEYRPVVGDLFGTSAPKLTVYNNKLIFAWAKGESAVAFNTMMEVYQLEGTVWVKKIIRTNLGVGPDDQPFNLRVIGGRLFAIVDGVHELDLSAGTAIQYGTDQGASDLFSLDDTVAELHAVGWMDESLNVGEYRDCVQEWNGSAWVQAGGGFFRNDGSTSAAIPLLGANNDSYKLMRRVLFWNGRWYTFGEHLDSTVGIGLGGSSIDQYQSPIVSWDGVSTLSNSPATASYGTILGGKAWIQERTWPTVGFAASLMSVYSMAVFDGVMYAAGLIDQICDQRTTGNKPSGLIKNLTPNTPGGTSWVRWNNRVASSPAFHENLTQCWSVCAYAGLASRVANCCDLGHRG